MSCNDFTEKVFEMFKNGEKEQAKEYIKKTINEAIENKMNMTSDYSKIIHKEITDFNSKPTDSLEKMAIEVFKRVKNTKDWHEMASLYLSKKGISNKEIDSVISILNDLYN